MVDTQTHVIIKEGLTNQLTAGVAIGFEGRRERDGSIACTKLEIFSNDSGRQERKMLRETIPRLTSNGEIVIHGEKYKLVLGRGSAKLCAACGGQTGSHRLSAGSSGRSDALDFPSSST